MPERMLDSIADVVGLPPSVVLVIAAMFAALIMGTIVRLTHLHRLPADQAASLRRRLGTWWVIAIVMTVIVMLGKPAVIAFMCLVSILALREYLSLLPDRAHYRRVEGWAYVAIPIQYLWIYLGWYDLFLTFVPVWVFLLLTFRFVLLGRPEGFLHDVGRLQWAVLILVFCMSHVAYLLVLPQEPNPTGGAIGLFLYLVILTEFNDIAQALWGRPFGKHKVIPSVSPGKSWEGLAGAIVCTTIVACLLAPLLTPLGRSPTSIDAPTFALGSFVSPWAALAGVLVGVGGFFGDITMSAVKRDCHVKDSGTMLPGQGGILDRIDSLTVTAPVFFHYVRFLYY